MKLSGRPIRRIACVRASDPSFPALCPSAARASRAGTRDRRGSRRHTPRDRRAAVRAAPRSNTFMRTTRCAQASHRIRRGAAAARSAACRCAVASARLVRATQKINLRAPASEDDAGAVDAHDDADHQREADRKIERAEGKQDHDLIAPGSTPPDARAGSRSRARWPPSRAPARQRQKHEQGQAAERKGFVSRYMVSSQVA